MSTQIGGGGSGEEDKDAKNMFDRIGKIVHDQVKNGDDAKKYIKELEGKLSLAPILGESAHTTNPCGLDYSKLISGSLASGVAARGHPCGKDGTGKEHRFSKERVDEYDEKKIRDTNKSKGGNNEGQCAPYRRLSLCNKNFQKINNYSSNAKHNLLLDVCLAAKHEGQSITRDYPKYRATYVDSPSEMCTMLARSFADIGDIIRGRDLYLGKKKKKQNGKETETERDQLEKELKEIFTQIHDDVTKGGKNGEVLKTRYGSDKENYYQLREDWWNANRQQVWKAITCKAEQNDKYFRNTCNGVERTTGYCRCGNDEPGNDKPNIDPPTYFDYVPQYLRWFEEWAEDFCTKRKHKLQNAITNCRGHYYGKPRYCSRNGYDCEQTIYKKGYFVIDKGCINCLYACNPYVEWIDNQRKQFDKQKKQCETVISGKPRQKRDAHGGSNDNGYEKIFYKKLKDDGNYSDVNAFLGLLSKETACEKQPQDGEKISSINFTNGNTEKTFSHTEYCQPCPLCGVELIGGGKFVDKDKTGKKCAGQNLYKPKPEANGTTINFLYSGDGQTEIGKKLKKFCDQTKNGSVAGGVAGDSGTSGSQDLYQKWKCYQIGELTKDGQDVGKDDKLEGAGGLCILEKTNGEEEVNKQKTYNNFFYYWVAHMLKDSIYWRTKKIKSCISNGKKTCLKKCKDDCDCYERWIGKKENEWKAIKQHFRNQEAFSNQGDMGNDTFLGEAFRSPDVVLEGVLELEFLNQNTEEDKENKVSAEEAEEIKHLRQMLKETADGVGTGVGGTGGSTDGKKKTLMDKLIDYEKEEAKKCKDCKKPQDKDLSRSEPTDDPQLRANQEESEEEDEDEDDEEEHHDGEEDEVEETDPPAEDQEEVKDNQEDEGSPKEEVELPPEDQEGSTTDPSVEVCKIVDELFKDTSKFKDVACTLKYSGNNSRLGWKCIPTGNTSNDNKGESSGKGEGGEATGERAGPPRSKRGAEPTTSGDTTGKDGAICVPPRRRRLYIQKLVEWASGNTQAGEASQVGGEPQVSPPATASGSHRDPLLTAFVESAAVETFFLWHRYKKEWEQRNKKTQDIQGYPLFEEEDDEDTIIEEDPETQLNAGHIPDEFKRQMFYTFSDYKDILFGKDKGSANDVQKIKTNIDNVFQNSGKRTSSAQNTEEQREEWWTKYGPHIWDGMVCALTYKKDEQTVNPQLNIQLTKEYDYNTIKISSTPISGDKKLTTTSTLSDFAKKPQFIRWFEEWAEEFCRKREYKLKKAKQECRGKEEGDKYFDGEGHDCTLPDESRNNSFLYLHSSGCQKECIKYKKWIVNKRNEFNKQKKKFENEIRNIDSKDHNKYDQEVCTNLKKMYPTFQKFVPRLNECPYCINSKVGGQIDFNRNGETFGSSQYCKACPVYGVNCKNTKQKCVPVNEETYKSTKGISVEKEKDREPTNINVLLLDRKGKKDDKYEDNDCKNAGFFEDASFQKWNCQKKNGVDQCKLTNFSGDIDDDTEMEFNVFFQQWLRYFVHDYNILKDKIKPCIKTKDEKSNKCINGCKGKLECVKKWLDEKAKEWNQIKIHYEKHAKFLEPSIPYGVKRYFDQLHFDNDHIKAQDVVEGEEEQKKLWGCTGHDECSEKEKEENKNFITNLIDKLQKKIKTCPTQPGGKTETQCKDPPLDDDTPDEPLDDYYIQQPKICPPPMTCVERAAEELRKEAEGKVSSIDDKLKGEGKNFNSECNKVIKENGVKGDDLCKLDKTYEKSMGFLKQTCNNNGKERFTIGQKWNSEYIRRIGKDLYIPPRREHMCIKHLKTISSYSDTDSKRLLQKVQEAAKREGDDIIKNLLLQNPCNENIICDALKYSFADLGDIIRGRDLLKNYGDQLRIQRRLINAFTKIYSNLERSKQTKYQKDITNLYELRSDWWDANRKDIWNAMTCVAPNDSKFLKKGKNFNSDSSSTNTLMSSDPKCGHQKDPPDYDYIPQPFRWMQEWSESFCKLLNEQIKKFETECKECKHNGITCIGDENGKKCEKCKKQCENYKELIDKWKLQFDKYKEAYKEIYNNKESKINSNEYFKKFLEKLKDKCKELNSSDKYIDEATHCTKYKFSNSENKNHNNYAFKSPPKEYERACECEPPDPLDQCPDGKNNNTHEKVCGTLSATKLCEGKTFNNDVDIWTSHFIQKSPGNYTGVLVPPRRRQLCIKNITTQLRSIQRNKDRFKTELMNSAYNEGKLLGEKYKDKEKAFQSMEYSFYDYGDIVKGTDMMDNWKIYNTKLDEVFKTNDGNKISENRGKWWANNKRQLWHAMLCGYKEAGGPIDKKNCELPQDDNTPQFLRWFQEWTEHFCARQQKLYNDVQTKCESAKCDPTNGIMDKEDCEEACNQYRDYITKKRQEYRIIMNQYNTNFNEKKAEVKNALQYFKNKCKGKCQCLFEYIDKEKEWEDVYGSFDDNDLKEKCVCKKIKRIINPNKKKNEDESASAQPKQEEDHIQPPPLPPKPDELPPPTPSTDNTSDILSSTIPFGIALALGSIAFLFMKKKSKSSVDLLRVLDIHKGDYGMPTMKSKNRYIPYRSGSYKGKTYIYMEGDTSGDEDKYIGDITSSDITSSESEYEELDINDIYVPGSPKYKTLIEVVLEPSKRDKPSDDIPHSNKFTDNEWNTLKDEFISQYLQSEQPNDVPNDYSSGDIPFNTEPNILYFDKPEEKPFITSIHDRDLYSGEEISYNIHMNTNSMDDTKYVSNNVYSGIDLINDSLSGEPINIYDELLKRKENELFGTNHVKQTSIHSVAKLTNSDPILNQINLFHTWLDRHRDMCEKLKNDNERLAKLKEKWENETHSGDIHTSDSNKTLNTDVSIQIHMDNPKPINQFNNMDTILEDLDKPFNEPYYYDMYDDDIYYDVNDHDTSTVDTNAMDVPSKVQIEMDVNTKLVKEKYPIADVWDI